MVVKLSVAARRALVAISKGEHVRENVTNLCAFGELASHDLIEVNDRLTKWRPSQRGWAALASLQEDA